MTDHDKPPNSGDTLQSRSGALTVMHHYVSRLWDESTPRHARLWHEPKSQPPRHRRLWASVRRFAVAVGIGALRPLRAAWRALGR